MKRITLKLSDELYARLSEQAEADHRSLQAQLVVLVEQATGRKLDTTYQAGTTGEGK